MKRTIFTLFATLCMALGQCRPTQAGQSSMSRPAKYALCSALAVVTVGALWFGYKKVFGSYLKRRRPSQASEVQEGSVRVHEQGDRDDEKKPQVPSSDDKNVTPNDEPVASPTARPDYFKQVYGKSPQGNQFFQFCQDWKELRAFYQELFGEQPKVSAFVEFCKDFVAFKERACGRPKERLALFKQRYNEFKQQLRRNPQFRELAWCQKYHAEHGSLPKDDNELTLFILRQRR